MATQRAVEHNALPHNGPSIYDQVPGVSTAALGALSSFQFCFVNTAKWPAPSIVVKALRGEASAAPQRNTRAAAERSVVKDSQSDKCFVRSGAGVQVRSVSLFRGFGGDLTERVPARDVRPELEEHRADGAFGGLG